jgi:CRISPR/Cas system-associated exonuclease Cas4 (RecB family)
VVKIYNRLLSPTAINTYLYCPRKYYLRYIKRLKSKLSIYLIRGNVVHKAIEKFHQKSGPDLKQTSLYNLASRLLRLFQTVWNQAKSEIGALKLGDEKIAGFCRESRLMMINFSQWLFNRGLPSATKTEVKLISRSLGLMGVIDAVYDSECAPALLGKLLVLL